MNAPGSFVSIGAGNVATLLCHELCIKGFFLKQVYSRTENSCVALASEYNAGFTTRIEDISDGADFYILALPDLIMPELLEKLKLTRKLIFHTAGTYGIEVFKGRFNKCGVLYPLQTFSKKRELDLSVVPLLIEGSDPETTAEIMGIAKKLSGVVIEMTSEKRKWLHLAAVFASNFTNHMYVLANELLEKENLDFALLYPIMEETLRKAQSDKPRSGQTGPAIRGDSNTMGHHLKLLAGNPDMQKLYTFISRNIQEGHSGSKINTFSDE